MKPETLELLTCPTCHGGLRLLGEASGSIESGSLACDPCSKEFPIDEGIPRFIRYEELTGLNRRFARLYDWFSYVYVNDDKYIKADEPVSPYCDCPCCTDYSLGYLHHLFKIKDSLSLRLATMHNLRFVTQLMERLRAKRR